MNEIAPECKLHDQILTGEKKAGDLTNKELLSLFKFRRWYQPSFDVYSIVLREMEKRRKD